MKIKIDDIPEEGQSLELSEEGSLLVEAAGVLDFEIGGKVEAHLDISKVGDQLVSVDGTLKAKTSTECSRCLKPIETELSVPFKDTFLLGADGAGGGEGKERELSFHDMDYTVMEGTEIDTNDILIEQIVLASEGNPLCKDDCKGLCRTCGVDLNKGTCGCVSTGQDEHIDKRFAKLKDLKLK